MVNKGASTTGKFFCPGGIFFLRGSPTSPIKSNLTLELSHYMVKGAFTTGKFFFHSNITYIAIFDLRSEPLYS